jgi:hypothetical protein
VPGEDRQQGGDGSLEAPLRGRRRSARHALGIWRLVAFITTTDALVQIGFCPDVGRYDRHFGRQFCQHPLAGADWQRWRPHDRGSASLKFISDRQRRILLDTVTASRDVSLLVARFDTVFNNNMPRGLCMINVVCNRRPRKL